MDFKLPMATTNERTPEYVLATDQRNELTVDPRVAGFKDVDELAIEHLCNRESFLCSGTLQLTDTPGTVLFNSAVTPLLFAVEPGMSNAEHHSPMSYVAHLFSAWRGNIRYRFVFHASAFHKAKVRITHDAIAVPTWGAAQNAMLNLGEHYIVDISEEREFTIEVGWTNPQKFLNIDNVDHRERWNTNAMSGHLPQDEANGMLVMVLENTMTSPYNLDPTDAEINFSVFVSGHDMTYAIPTEGGTSSMMFGPTEPTPPAVTRPPTANRRGKRTVAHAAVDPTSVVDDISAGSTISHTFGTKVNTDEPTGLIYIGEKVLSLRSLLKRYTNYSMLQHEQTQSVMSKIWFRNFPISRGFENDNVLPWRSMTILNFVGQMFLARRGGVRWIIRNLQDKPLNVEAVAIPYNQFINYAEPPTDFERMRWYLEAIDNGFAGQQNGKSELNVMVPGSSPHRFSLARKDTGWVRSMGFSIVTEASDESPLRLFLAVAGAEDLTFHGFIGTPIVYRGRVI
jgi:hypothetical protein